MALLLHNCTANIQIFFLQLYVPASCLIFWSLLGDGPCKEIYIKTVIKIEKYVEKILRELEVQGR